MNLAAHTNRESKMESLAEQRVALSNRMYLLAVDQCANKGMSVKDAAETFMVDQAVLACRVDAMIKAMFKGQQRGTYRTSRGKS